MTTVRLLLFIPFTLLFHAGEYALAATTYFVALITDLDGAIARKLHATSFFGSIYDPVVDAAFMLGGFVLLLPTGKVLPVAVYIFLLCLVYKFVPQLMYLLRNRQVKSTMASKTLGFVGFSSVLLATLGAPLLVTTVLLLLGAAGNIWLGTYWFSGAGSSSFRR